MFNAMLKTAIPVIFVALTFFACSHDHAEAEHDHDGHNHAKAEDTHNHDEHGNAESDDAHDSDSHHGHQHSEENSDLDRPISDLFADVCEHDIPTHQCAECRYEVGVVRVPQSLIDGGLVKTGRVSMPVGETTVDLTGEIALDARSVVYLSPLASGVVVRTLADLGQRVKTGQALVLIRSSELAQAQSDFLEADSRSRLARTTHDRQTALRESGVNSERERLEAEQEWGSSQIRLEAARQRLVNLGMTSSEIEGLAAKGMRAATGEWTLRAPLSGIVLEMNASAPGVQVTPEERALLIGDPARLWLWADLYERDLPGVMHLHRTGARAVSFSVQAYPGELFPGTIDFVGSVMDAKTRTVKVRISLENPDGRLHSGMFAKVRVSLPSAISARAVPSAAVLSDEGRDFVFVKHEGEFFVRRPVVKGAEREGLTEIALGLEENQIVAADGAFLLKSDVLRSKMGAGCAD